MGTLKGSACTKNEAYEKPIESCADQKITFYLNVPKHKRVQKTKLKAKLQVFLIP